MAVRQFIDFLRRQPAENFTRHCTEQCVTMSVQPLEMAKEQDQFFYVSEVQPIVDYVSSGWSLASAPDGGRESVLCEVERRARAVIDADGAFRIRTDVGCFVCR